MHAFLICTTDELLYQSKIDEIIQSNSAIKYDFNLQKIEDVRELNDFTKLSLRQKTAIVLKNINQASIEAQNALLKTIEEPQENLIFILTTTNLEQVVPTITSRAEVIELQSDSYDATKDTQFTKEFLDKSTAERLITTSKIKKREDAIEFMEKLILGSHSLMLKSEVNALFVESALATFERLKQNGNVQIQLTNFVLQLE